MVADAPGPAHPGYRWLRFPVLPGFDTGHPAAALRPAGRALAALRSDPPDVVHLHGYGPLCRQVLRALPGVPAVVTVHHFPDGSGTPALPGLHAAMFVALRRLLERSAAVVVPSAAARRRLPPGWHASASVVPTGVAPALAATAGSAAPRTGGPLRVLIVGRRSREKGFDQVQRLALQHPEAHWTAIGGGPMRGGPAIRLIDHVAPADIGRHYREADVLFAPSLLETQGLVALEALTLGLPVAAPRGSAQAECVTEGSTGALYPANDAAAAWAAIQAAARLAGGAVAPPAGFDEASLVGALAVVYARARGRDGAPSDTPEERR